MIQRCWYFVAGILLGLPVHAQETHPFSIHDMLAMKRISEPVVSPDGLQIAFTLRETDIEENRGRTDLWSVQSDGKDLRRLTTHPEGDHSACWTPDGRALFFISSRSGSSQAWRLSMDGGEAAPVTDLPLDVANLVLSPDGQWIAFALEVFPELDSIAATQERLEVMAKRKSTGRLYDRIFIRHWDTWKDGRRSHVFVMRATGEGDPVDVMQRMDADCPTKPFGGSEDFTFTPDSQGIVFTARAAGRNEPWSTNFDLYFAPIDGSRNPLRLTESEAWDGSPVFSPDGETLAYLAMQRPGYESDRFRIVLRSWPEGTDRVLTEEWDRSPSEFCWSPSGDAIFATAANLGQRSLFAIDTRTGQRRTVIRDGSIRSPSVVGDRVFFGRNDLKSPTELWSATTGGADLAPVTRMNEQEVASARMGDFEPFTFAGHNGETVHGYVVKPIDFSPDRKYPVAFLIHGGPQGSFGNMFHYRWNPQAYAGAGYAAIMIDFHGSVGYGQAFTDSIRGDWGGKPFEDLQKGLAAALNRYPWLDGERVGALGASFGGYMINWIAGNWPDRFRCLVNHDGNLDERMAYYDTEELWFPEWDHMGTPWDNPEGYEKQNPVNFVQNWKTPMLVIHGAKDYRVADTQGIGTFNVLQRRGIPSQLLYFPDENHWVLQPHNSILWHDTVLSWLDQWVKGTSGPRGIR